MKALHLVVSYELIFREDFHLKTEVYYQYLFDVPVSQNPDEVISTINGDVGLDTLVSSGREGISGSSSHWRNTSRTSIIFW